MSKLILKGYILIPEADLKVVVKEIEVHTALTRQEMGCLTFGISEDMNNPNKFGVYEEFASESAFDKHQKRVKESNWGNVSNRVERHYQTTYD